MNGLQQIVNLRGGLYNLAMIPQFCWKLQLYLTYYPAHLFPELTSPQNRSPRRTPNEQRTAIPTHPITSSKHASSLKPIHR
jgi:hypothetical protein